MKKILNLILLVSFPSVIFAEVTSAFKIMENLKWRNDGQSRASEIKLDIVDSNGNTRTRKIEYIELDKGKSRFTILYVDSPRDVRKTTILIKNDSSRKNHTKSDIWLYIPILGKTKKLSSKNKSGSFVGSNFQYSDLEWIILEDFIYTLKGEEKVNGRSCYKVEAKALDKNVIEKTSYSKKILWIDKKYDLIVKEDFFNRDGFLFKQLRVNKIKKIDGIRTIVKQTISNLINSQKSIMSLSNVKYDINPSPSIFRKQSLGERPRW